MSSSYSSYPTATHLLDHYKENLNVEEEVLRVFYVMTKNSTTDHELFMEWIAFTYSYGNMNH